VEETRDSDARARLAAIVDSADAIIGKTLDGVITDWNAAATQLFGYTAEEMTGRNVAELVPPDRQAELADILDRVRKGEPVHHLDTQRIRKDGHLIDVALSVSPIKNASGTVVGAATLARDITEVKRIQDALRRSEALLNQAQQVAHVGGWEYDTGTGHTAWTDETYRIYGVTRQSYDPNSLERNMAFFSPEDEQSLWDAFDAARTTGKPYDMELRFTNAQGDKRWIRVAAEPEQREGRVVRVYGHIMDVTDLHNARDQLIQLNTELEKRTAELDAANRSLQTFAHTVAHDLHAPLRALSGFSGALMDEYADRLDDTARGYIGRITEASERMGLLIDSLLQLTRLDRAELNLQAVDLSRLVREVATGMAQAEPDRHVEMNIQDGVIVTADPSLTRDAIQNLLSNAWKFTQRRDQARISFATLPARGNLICCCIRDNGTGFDPQDASKLFEPFQRLHPAHEYPGTGIGLATVRRIVERHGGRIWAESHDHSGATFYFTLPPATAARLGPST